MNDIKKCPKCNGKLGYKSGGEHCYGAYEFNEWYCLQCGYSEQEYYYDEMEKERELNEN